MSTVGNDPMRDEIVRLEALAEALDDDDLTPERMRDLADEALEIAQRVSALIADAGPIRGPSDPPRPGVS